MSESTGAEEVTWASLESDYRQLMEEINSSYSEERRSVPFMERMMAFFDNTATFIRNRLTNKGDLVEPVNENVYWRLARNVQYPNVADVRISVPMGLSAPLTEYFATLQSVGGYLSNLEGDVLGPARDYFLRLLQDPEQLQSNRSPSILVKELAGEERGQLQSKLQEHFDKGGEDRVPYSTLLRRQKDWQEVPQQYNECVNALQTLPTKKLEKKVDETEDAFLTLKKRIEEDEETYVLSPTMRQAVPKVLFAIATEVEFYGFYQTSLLESQTVLENCYKTLKSSSEK